ncbi:MAG: S1 RNA-binding domain-containing protein [Culicoidibacterales bacterium]
MELEIKTFKVGERIIGTVIGVDKDVIYMDVGASCDAKIDKQHYSFEQVSDFRETVKVGDEIKTMITFVSDEQVLLSRLPFEKEVLMEEYKEKMKEQAVISLEFERFNRGGLEHKGMFTFFMPVSQIGIKGAEPKNYVDQAFDVVITDIDEKRQQIIVSARKLVDQAYKQKRVETLATLEVNKTIETKITSIVGAGLEVQYEDMIRGFVPRKEVSYLQIAELEAIYTIGQTVEVMIKEIRKDNQFIASIKALLPTPWEQFMATYKAGDVVDAKIKKIIEIGAFVEVLPGVEGLLHKSEVSFDTYVNFKDIISENEAVKVKIIMIDADKRKLSLSIKKLEADPWDTLWETHHVGDIVNVKVKRIERNHLWVNLIQYVDAMFYKRETLLEENQELSDNFKEGQTLEVQITELNPSRRRVVVSQASIIRAEEQKQLDEYRTRVENEIKNEDNSLKSIFQAALGNDDSR